MSELQDALTEYDQKGGGLNVLPASSPAMIAILDAARRVANLDMMAAGDAIIDAGVADLPGIGAVGHVLARIAVNTALGITTEDDK